jgi:omega-amidase
MRVALVSLNQIWENKSETFQACCSFVQRAKAQDAELAIFPEMTLTAFSMNTGDTTEERPTSATVELFKQLAQEFQIAIVFGVMFRAGGKATNNAMMVDGEGNVKASYSKIHPFTFAGENMVFNGGNEICAVKLSSNCRQWQ